MRGEYANGEIAMFNIVAFWENLKDHFPESSQYIMKTAKVVLYLPKFFNRSLLVRLIQVLVLDGTFP